MDVPIHQFGAGSEKMAPVDRLESGVVTGPSGESFAWRVELAPKPSL